MMPRRILPPIEELQTWSSDQLIQWVKLIGLDDCIPSFVERNISGSEFSTLNHDDLMQWTELPVVRRRQLAQYLQHCSKISHHREKSIKGIFETLSRRRKSCGAPPPLPLPADYGKQRSASVTAIVISPGHITSVRKLHLDKDANDWGSEFSDSEAETEEHSSTNEHDARSTSGNSREGGGSGSFTEEDFMQAEEDGFAENIYELPDEHTTHLQRHPFQRSCSNDSSSSLPKPPSFPTSISTTSAAHRPNPLQATEVAERLNKILANRPPHAGCSLPTSPLAHTPKGNSVSAGNLMALSRTISAGPLSPTQDWERLRQRDSAPVEESDTYTDTRQRPQLPPKPKMFSQRSPSVDPLEPYSWFHGKIDRVETCKRLERTCMDGAFIVRRSLKGVNKFGSPYSLSLYFAGKVYHLTVRQRVDNMYALGFEKRGEQAFFTVPELVEYHCRNPIYLAECDQGVLLVLALTKTILC